MAARAHFTVGIVGFAVLVASVLPGTARATTPERPGCAADAALSLATGLEATRLKMYGEAVTAFERANACAPSSEKLWRLAIALLQAERFVEARRRFQEYARTPDVRADRVRQLRTVHLPRIMARVSRLQVLAPEGAAIFVDGEAQPADAAQALVVDPVEHDVAVVSEGTRESRSVRMQAGQTTVVVFASVRSAALDAAIRPLEQASSDAPAQPAPPPVPPTAQAQLRTERLAGRPVALVGLLTLAVTSAAIGTYFLLDARDARAKGTALARANAGAPCLFYGSRTCSDLLATEQTVAQGEGFARAFFVAGGAFLIAAPIVWLAWPKREITLSGWSDARKTGLTVAGRF